LTVPDRPQRPPIASAQELSRVQDSWAAVLAAVATQDKSLAALLKDCRAVSADGESVTLGFFYQFHCDRVTDPARRRLVEEALGQVLGSPRRIVCTVVPASPAEASARPKSKTDQAKADPVVRHAIEQLGAQISGVQREEEAG
jgi:DNA polymerase-3 subunit gamma/tau